MKKSNSGGSEGGGLLGQGLSSKDSFGSKDTCAKPSSTGRAMKRPTKAVGTRDLKIKGTM